MTVACTRRWRLLPASVAGPWAVSCLQLAAAGLRVAAARGGGDVVRSGGERQPGCVQMLGGKAGVEPAVGPRLMQRGISMSVASLQYNSRKVSSLEGQKFYFDTHAVVRHLEECGFSSKQSEAVVATLLRIMNSNMEITYKDMATKIQQEIMLQQIMSHIAAVKKDMIILEKSEFSALRAANEKLKIELQQLKKQLTDEVVKVSSNNKLDLNLEKSRVQEMLTEHEKRVLETKADIVELHSHQERAVTQANRKIDTEVAGLKTLLESHKLDTIKYLAGSVFTCLTIVLGFYRLWV
ncbi:mitochondrial calcium uniporter regulator 1 isoform X1 [Pristis pectinata]|uniref:mitochondrial calcium uniporter regulator 1 isoform X1 n=2 Tax=Pristis pectinata TaxID=685728 RepID=UPI00223E2771|nr:mitochondrial calcium uniporter regulator 1 isoform X1 [Pristis pectinata]